MNAWLAFFIGLFIGAWLGAIVMAICAASGRADEKMGAK